MAHDHPRSPVRLNGITDIDPAYLAPRFWLARLHAPASILLSRKAIAAWNENVLRLDQHVHDLRKVPVTVDGASVTTWISGLAGQLARPLYDAQSRPIAAGKLAGVLRRLALDTIPAQVSVRYGLVVKRAALRRFPTMLRAFSRRGEIDLDRFQESTAVPGTPLAVLHASHDRKWYFVETPRYRAWLQRSHVAIGSRQQVLDYTDKVPFRVVAGASVRTVFTPEQAGVSELELDMGTRVPVDPTWPSDHPVNGQGPSGSHVIELPLRGTNGRLRFTRALLQRVADTRGQYLAATRANIIRQSFKLLGQRYGWGGTYDAHDCSSFVADVYRSMGILMPRNTHTQSVSPIPNRTTFDKASTYAARVRAVQRVGVGDLIYTPDHVMLVIGHVDDEPYVIHDVLDTAYRDAGGKFHRVKQNGVSVTPLLPLLFNRRQTLVDRMTTIVRILPPKP